MKVPIFLKDLQILQVIPFAVSLSLLNSFFQRGNKLPHVACPLVR